jgi:hypothetical protein
MKVDNEGMGWDHLVTLDMEPDMDPDHLHDLDVLPYPFADETFDQIHAYNVLEHQGHLGDWRFFFDQWNEFGRIMKPKGRFYGIVPSLMSSWLFGDPGHTRVITADMLQFLDAGFYGAGKTQTDGYLKYLSSSWKIVALTDDKVHLGFVLERQP